MRRGHQDSTVCALLALLAASACGSSDSNNSALDPYVPEYMFGGQTGSLVPDCGVAPLSEQGHAVPVGDALAVLYTSGCPDEPIVERVSLAAGDEPVMVQLEPLGGTTGVYLVRASEVLSGGGYELAVSGNAVQTLMVASGAVPLPARLGELHAVPAGDACADELEFELELDVQALAYAPLLRLSARIDGGSKQLLVDYGALELAATEQRAASVQLPRCAGQVCLSQGGHLLELEAEIAGETLVTETVAAAFDVHCGPTLSGVMQTEETDFNCSSARVKGRSSWLLMLMLVLGVLPRLRSSAARLHRSRPRRP